MKKLLLPAILFVTLFYACGPASEDRFRMDAVARRTSDSIGKWLDSSLNAPSKELGLPLATPQNNNADTAKKQ